MTCFQNSFDNFQMLNQFTWRPVVAFIRFSLQTRYVPNRFFIKVRSIN